MKRKYVYIIVSLFIVVLLSITSLNKNSNVSYSIATNPDAACNEYGYSVQPKTIIHMYNKLDGSNTTITSGARVITSDMLPTLSYAGYRFLGWYYGGSLVHYTVPTVEAPVYQGGQTHYVRCYKRVEIGVDAKWENICNTSTNYPVYFISNGGSSIADSITTVVSNQYSSGTLPKPTRSGYTFNGWYVDSGLTKKFNGMNYELQTFMLTNGCQSSKTYLYAKWTKVEPTSNCPSTDVLELYFEPNGGPAVSMQGRTGAKGSVTFNLPSISRSGYTFNGWYKESTLKNKASGNYNGINFTTKTVNGCTVYVGTVYAKWTKDPDKPSEPSQPTTPREPTPATPQNPTNPSGGIGGKTVNTCPNVINTLSISFNTKGGSHIDDVNICLTCEAEEITLPTPVLEGKNFVGWYSDENLENEVIVNGLNTDIQLSQFKLFIDKDEDGCDSDTAQTVLYARYEESTCSTPDIANIDINFVSGEDNPIENVRSCLDCDDEFSELPILKREGYLFGGWYIDADYSRLVNKKINLDNAVKYMNVTRNFENDCSTDTISTILYAKWIPLTDVKNVRIMFISQGNIIGEKIYTLNQKEIETPDINDKNSKLIGWYTDSSYQQTVSNLDDLLADTYGAEFRNGQLYVYVYAKTEAVNGFNLNNNKLIIIGVIAAVTIGVGYIVISEHKDKKKKKGNRVTWHT